MKDNLGGLKDHLRGQLNDRHLHIHIIAPSLHDLQCERTINKVSKMLKDSLLRGSRNPSDFTQNLFQTRRDELELRFGDGEFVLEGTLFGAESSPLFLGFLDHRHSGHGKLGNDT